jgi:hypothetical protein
MDEMGQKAFHWQCQFADSNGKLFCMSPSSDQMSYWSHQEVTSPPSIVPICKNIAFFFTGFFCTIVARVYACFSSH